MIRDTADTPNIKSSGMLHGTDDVILCPTEPVHPQSQPSGPPMRVVERGVYRGPNLYGSMPMVRIQVDLGALENWPSNKVPGFNGSLLTLLPGLRRHGCS